MFGVPLALSPPVSNPLFLLAFVPCAALSFGCALVENTDDVLSLWVRSKEE